ncbi:IS3 family transposase [Virgibacillus proomii]|uniref:IS3 family transposase n=1 Tax=Virgibacillus proomii TaxID=84407 RepID=UPI00359F5B3A
MLISSHFQFGGELLLLRWKFNTYAQVNEVVAEFMVYYNERRMHSSILDLSPTEFYVK